MDSESILEWFEMVGSRFSKGISNDDLIEFASSLKLESTKVSNEDSPSENSDLISFLVRTNRFPICFGVTLKRIAI